MQYFFPSIFFTDLYSSVSTLKLLWIPRFLFLLWNFSKPIGKSVHEKIENFFKWLKKKNENFDKRVQKEITNFIKRLCKISRISVNDWRKNVANFVKKSQKWVEYFIYWYENVSRIFPIGCGKLWRISTNDPCRKINFVNRLQRKMNFMKWSR